MTPRWFCLWGGGGGGRVRGDRKWGQNTGDWREVGSLPRRSFVGLGRRGRRLEREYGTEGLLGWGRKKFDNRMAIFGDRARRDRALEFPDGTVILLTRLLEGQKAVVLQLPAQPTTASEAEAQKRVVHVG